MHYTECTALRIHCICQVSAAGDVQSIIAWYVCAWCVCNVWCVMCVWCVMMCGVCVMCDACVMCNMWCVWCVCDAWRALEQKKRAMAQAEEERRRRALEERRQAQREATERCKMAISRLRASSRPLHPRARDIPVECKYIHWNISLVYKLHGLLFQSNSGTLIWACWVTSLEHLNLQT